ncbi:hypothetical protein EB241_20410 [Erwinia psidii]|uniref:Uncharacterized protein n=1 Tax=Erwinia psidii TaxID=69224 RepID=A0A3N6UKH1_9GAMM|nr:hypothetical protein EB241_20410 [Erwinia psidii]
MLKALNSAALAISEQCYEKPTFPLARWLIPPPDMIKVDIPCKQHAQPLSCRREWGLSTGGRD